MAYIIEGQLTDGYSVDLWADYENADSLIEWNEVKTEEEKDALVHQLQVAGHKLPPDWEVDA